MNERIQSHVFLSLKHHGKVGGRQHLPAALSIATLPISRPVESIPSYLLIFRKMKVLAAITLLVVSTGGVSAFAPAPVVDHSSTTSLHAMTPKKAAVSAVAAAFLAGNLAMAEPAMALMDNAPTVDFGSSQVVAGRSGGRAGGRSSARMSAPRRSSYGSTSSSRTVINRTYVAPPVMVSPYGGGYGYGYGYNPLPGIGECNR